MKIFPPQRARRIDTIYIYIYVLFTRGSGDFLTCFHDQSVDIMFPFLELDVALSACQVTA